MILDILTHHRSGYKRAPFQKPAPFDLFFAKKYLYYPPNGNIQLRSFCLANRTVFYYDTYNTSVVKGM